MPCKDELKLENQLCFPLYACAKEITRRAKPFLDELDLTYTQYLAMLVLWEYGTVSSKQMGQLLYLDSGTLTPLLKKLEQKGYLRRARDAQDTRNLLVELTPAGQALQQRAAAVPARMMCCMQLSCEEAANLRATLNKLLGCLSGQGRRFRKRADPAAEVYRRRKIAYILLRIFSDVPPGAKSVRRFVKTTNFRKKV